MLKFLKFHYRTARLFTKQWWCLLWWWQSSGDAYEYEDSAYEGEGIPDADELSETEDRYGPGRWKRAHCVTLASSMYQ